MTARPSRLAALVLLVLAPACGHRGAPLPPLRKTPPALEDFRLSQRGDRLELSATSPRASVDGVVYERITVEFLYGEGEVDLEKKGQRLAVPTEGGLPVLRTLPVPAPGTLVRAIARAASGHDIGARTLTRALVAQAPLEAPRELTAQLAEGGVALAWRGTRPKPVAPPVAARPPAGPPVPPAVRPSEAPAPASPTASTPPPTAAAPTGPAPTAPAPTTATGSAKDAAPPSGPGASKEPAAPEPRRSGFLVYRRMGEAAYGAPLLEPPLELRGYIDTTAPLGAAVCYVVRAAGSTDPLIESAASNEACVTARDIEPPAAPAGLAILPREGGLEVLWSASPEPDLAGYRLYRAAGAAPPERIAEVPAGKTAFLDETAQKGVVYRYSVSAFDQAGNESPPTGAVESSLP